MIRWILILGLVIAVLAVAGTPIYAQGSKGAKPAERLGPQTFDFKDRKEMNAVSLFIDARFEPVTGYADGVSGYAQFDPAKPEATTGKIAVSVESIRVSNAGYTQTIRNYALQGKKYPELTCELKKIVSGRVIKPGVYEGKVAVDFTAKGVTRRLTVPLMMNYYRGIGPFREPDPQCDMLVVRSNFIIRRSEFGIASDVSTDLVPDTIEIRVAVCGFADRSKPATKPAPVPSAKPTPPAKPISAAAPQGIEPPTALALNVSGKPYPIQERMAFYKVPGVSVAVIRNFTPRKVLHFGEARQGQPVTDDTRYPVGAMGHPVAAAVALCAADRGLINLDADINTYLKSWKVPASSFLKAGRGVTVRDLLTQRSGFTYHKYLGYPLDTPLPSLLSVLKGEAPAVTPPITVEFEPGTRYALAAANYVVLEQIACDLSGSLDQLSRNQVFDPLGIKSAAFVPVPVADWRLNAACGHDNTGKQLPGGWHAYPETGASGLWITPRDFSIFLADLLRAAAGKEGTRIPLASARLMLEAISESAQDGDDPQSIGFGISPRGGVRYLFRGGNAAGFYCHADIDPEMGNAVIVFMNGDLCWRLSNEIRDAVAHAEGFRGF